MAQIFISHTNEDLAVAIAVRNWLRDEGHHVFLDRDLQEGIEVGEAWKRRLYRELRAADAVVCLVSSASIGSQWCSAEIGIADVVGSRLLPLCVEKGVTSKLLDGLQYVDYHDPEWGEKLAVALRGIDAAGGVGWASERSPFPGLRPFDAGMAQVFCGRADEVRRLAGRLRSLGDRARGGLLLVVGPSGCGKSSLVRAGLLAQMAAEAGWETVPPLLPGSDPIGALARALTVAAKRVGVDSSILDTRRTLDRDEGLAALADELLIAGRGPARERLLLVVDQSEELITRSSAAGRARLATLLRCATAGPVRAVFTLRSEFADQLLTMPEIAGIDVDTFPLRPLARDMLRVVVEEPAKVAGLAVDRELVDRLVADTDGGEALPLLAFTLNRLADGLSRGDTLSAVRYEDLGGVQGALSHHADVALAEAVVASGLAREHVLAGLVRLATLDEAGRGVRRRIDMAGLPASVRAAFGVFVDKRLLTTSGDDGTNRVGVAHEALLTSWPPLSAAIDEHAVALRAARSVEQAAAEWREGGRPDHFLWDADRLTVTLTTLGSQPTVFPTLPTTPTRPTPPTAPATPPSRSARSSTSTPTGGPFWSPPDVESRC